jgi:hypothetical protein
MQVPLFVRYMYFPITIYVQVDQVNAIQETCRVLIRWSAVLHPVSGVVEFSAGGQQIVPDPVVHVTVQTADRFTRVQSETSSPVDDTH